MDVSDRRLHRPAQEAKIPSVFSFIWAIFAFAGFAGALKRRAGKPGGDSAPPPGVNPGKTA